MEGGPDVQVRAKAGEKMKRTSKHIRQAARRVSSFAPLRAGSLPLSGRCGGGFFGFVSTAARLTIVTGSFPGAARGRGPTSIFSFFRARRKKIGVISYSGWR